MLQSKAPRERGFLFVPGILRRARILLRAEPRFP
jgi:hypothetical protein